MTIKDVENSLLDINLLLSGDWEQLRKLFSFFYGEDSCDVSEKIDKDYIISLLQHETIHSNTSLLESIDQQIGTPHKLDSETKSILKFIDVLFSSYIKDSSLENGLKQTLNSFRTTAAIYLLNNQLPWSDNNDLADLLNLIYNYSIGWQPSLGSAAERFLNLLIPFIQDLSKNDDTYASSHQSLQDFFNKEQQRVSKLEKRLCDKETGALRAKHANQLAARSLNQLMAGKKLPAEVSSFLQAPLFESMRLIILNNGKHSNEWEKILHLTTVLITSFEPLNENSKNNQQQLYHSIADLTDQLKETTIGLQYSSQIEEELSLVENQLLKILKNEPINFQPFNLIENTNPLLNSQISVSSGLIDQAKCFQIGQWFTWNEDDKTNTKRIKLIAKVSDDQQLLFSNFIGIKAAQLNIEEFSYLLSSKIIAPLPANDSFKSAAEKTIQSLQQSYNDKLQKETAAELEKQLLLHQQEKERSESREKALKEALLANQIKKETEQLAYIEEERRLKKQAAKEQEAEIEKSIAKLKIGATLIFTDEDDSATQNHCKLAAIIQSSIEYIFVNREGIKQYRLSKPELAKKLLFKNAKILDLGSNFDKTLEQVVTSLRKKK